MKISAKAKLKMRALAAVREYGIHLKRLQAAVDEAAGLNATDTECLRFLFIQRVATPSQLARQTGLTSGATTAMLDRLEAAGLIERKPNPDDRRGTLITPTPSSSDKMSSWFESARRAQDELISTYSSNDLKIIAGVFESFARLWDQEREKVQGTNLKRSMT